ncbi:MAG: hypothetical protein H0U72_13755 [Nitrosospira sp.]|nr:hypothetical protein [Nitrosospira sp.]
MNNSHAQESAQEVPLQAAPEVNEVSLTIKQLRSNPEAYALVAKRLHWDLTFRAFDIVSDNLTKFGNELGEEHRLALMELVGGFTLLAFGQKKGRYAYPLPTGMGKTQSIVAWCAALHGLEYTDISVAVAAGKVEALCQLKRDLISNGVPPEAIGLVHSYNYEAGQAGELLNGYASESSTRDNDDRQIMLVTHTRINKNNLSQFNQYQGNPRSLLIWDESLLVSEARVISHKQIKKSFGYRSPDLSPDCEAVKFFNEVIPVIDEELERQRLGGEAKVIRLPVLTGLEVDIIKRQVGKGPVEEVLRSFMDISQEPVRVAYTQQEGGLISYDLVVPPELETIAILDASYPIRDLEKMDKSIRLGGKFSQGMKQYEQVTIHHLKAAAGRESMTKDFSNARMENRKVCSEVCNLVADIPESEALIIFTFKQSEGSYGAKKNVDFKDQLRKDLRSSGININAKLEEGNSTVDRIVFLTWGQETSLSQYSYARHVVFAGVLHRGHLGLASSIAGQADDILSPITTSAIKEVLTSEIAHSVYQAMSRGSCRKIIGNQACKMDAWLIHNSEDIRPRIEQVMPGVKWVPWEGKHLTSTYTQQVITQTIIDYISGLPTSLDKVSISRLKKALGHTKVPRSTFTRAMGEALEDSSGWKMEGLSLVRYSGKDYFPEHE